VLRSLAEVADSVFTLNEATLAGGGAIIAASLTQVGAQPALARNLPVAPTTARSALSGLTGVLRSRFQNANPGWLRVRGSRFADNRGPSGGAILGWHMPITIIGSRFTGNLAAAGGAIACESGCALELSDSLLAGNDADVGSGSWHSERDPRFRARGGGVLVDAASDAVVRRTTFDTNRAQDGAGFACVGQSTCAGARLDLCWLAVCCAASISCC
jgi:predicted outer membrane repeat protein